MLFYERGAQSPPPAWPANIFATSELQAFLYGSVANFVNAVCREEGLVPKAEKADLDLAEKVLAFSTQYVWTILVRVRV